MPLSQTNHLFWNMVTKQAIYTKAYIARFNLNCTRFEGLWMYQICDSPISKISTKSLHEGNAQCTIFYVYLNVHAMLKMYCFTIF